MTTRFCLAHFAPKPPQSFDAALDAGPLTGDLLRKGFKRLAVEVLRGAPDDPAGRESIAVLVAAAKDAGEPLTCVFGYSNNPRWCTEASGAGFPMTEAQIDIGNGKLAVRAARFPDVADSQASALSIGAVLTMNGIDPPAVAMAPEDQTVNYEQLQRAPDTVEPASTLLTVRRPWASKRKGVRPIEPCNVDIAFDTVRYPNFPALLGTPLMADAARNGEVADWPPSAAQTYERPTRMPRADIFGPPTFRFEDVELIGFRIDLKRDGKRADGLERLIRGLNFHLDESKTGQHVSDDFRYRVASSAVIIELLRYGNMKSTVPMRPLREDDYMAQHELLVRVLVGKVDDDTAQAREAATFVPAIFVDNPWSKAVGREFQGFPKELASFLGRDSKPLRMDGRTDDNSKPVPLVDVREIRLVQRYGFEPDKASSLLKLSYSSDTFDDRFERVDLATILGRGLLPSSPWRQQDFDEREFRRSFAGGVIADGFTRFGSIQVTPLDQRPLPKAWIRGNFTLKNLSVQFPAAVANLTFGRGPLAPAHPWAVLCDLLGAPPRGKAGIDLSSGSWYRGRCSMELEIDDGLEW